MSHYFAEEGYEKLKAVVKRDAEVWEDEARDYLVSVSDHGCFGGNCTDLVTYAQTHAFFDEHYNAIETVRQNWQEESGSQIRIVGDLKNCFAWFAYEIVATELLHELYEE